VSVADGATMSTSVPRPRTASGDAAAVPTLGLCERSGLEELTLSAAVAPSPRNHYQQPPIRESWIEPSEEALAAGATVGFFSSASSRTTSAAHAAATARAEGGGGGGSVVARDIEAMRAAIKAGSALAKADTDGFAHTGARGAAAEALVSSVVDSDTVGSPPRSPRDVGGSGGVWASKSLRETHVSPAVAELKLCSSNGDDSPEFDAGKNFQVLCPHQRPDEASKGYGYEFWVMRWGWCQWRVSGETGDMLSDVRRWWGEEQLGAHIITDVRRWWGEEQLGAHIITDTDAGADQQSPLLLGRAEEEACWAPQARYSACHPPALLLPHRIVYTLGRSGQVRERCMCVCCVWSTRCDAHSGRP
jgi:hypothetical protein